MNLPDVLTVARLLAVPALMLLLLGNSPHLDRWAAALFPAASPTDTLDGRLAVWAAVISTVLSGLDSLWRFRHVVGWTRARGAPSRRSGAHRMPGRQHLE